MEKENNQKKYGSNDKKRQKKIANPTEQNLSYYEEIMGMDFQMSMGFLLTSLKKRQKKIANPTEMQNQKTVQMDLLLLYENLFISPLIC